MSDSRIAARSADQGDHVSACAPSPAPEVLSRLEDESERLPPSRHSGKCRSHELRHAHSEPHLVYHLRDLGLVSGDRHPQSGPEVGATHAGEGLRLLSQSHLLQFSADQDHTRYSDDGIL